MHLHDTKQYKKKGYLPIACLFSVDVLQVPLDAKNFKPTSRSKPDVPHFTFYHLAPISMPNCSRGVP